MAEDGRVQTAVQESRSVEHAGARLPPGFFVCASSGRSLPPRVEVRRRHGSAVGTRASGVGGVVVRLDCALTSRAALCDDGPTGAVIASGDVLWEEDALVTFSPFDAVVTAAQLHPPGSHLAPFAEAAVGLWGMLERQRSVSSSGSASAHRKGFGLAVRALLHGLEQSRGARVRTAVEGALLLCAPLLPHGVEWRCVGARGARGQPEELPLAAAYPTADAARTPITIATLLARAADTCASRGATRSGPDTAGAAPGDLRTAAEALALLLHEAEERAWPVVDTMIDAATGREAEAEGARVAASSDSVYGLFAISNHVARVRLRGGCNAELRIIEDLETGGTGGGGGGGAIRVQCVATRALRPGDEVRLLPAPLVQVDGVRRVAGTDHVSDRDRLRHFMGTLRSNPESLQRVLEARERHLQGGPDVQQ